MRYAFLKYIADINKRKFAKPLMKKETRDNWWFSTNNQI
jgi:hypothetical protein